MINFALDVVGTSVTSDKVSTDGYEPTNLISSNGHLRRNGFLVEHFIKPPVNVTFSLPCPVKIYQVIFNPSIGQQQSLQFEMYAASVPCPRAMKEGQMSDSWSKTEVPPFFYCLGKASVSNNSPMCFYNERFGRSLQSQSSDVPLPSSFTNNALMRHSKKELMIACSHLCVRITQTHAGSTACLGNIYIWGVPSYFLSNILRAQIFHKYRSAFNTNLPLSTASSSKINTDVEQQKSETFSGDSVTPGLEIPEEFIDPITCEIMAIPMLLPCGKNVDMGTLEKFYKSEALFGRKPRDPFTGVDFTDSCRPLPNGALKGRIDQFLLKHGEDSSLSSVARTVGRSTKAASSTLVSSSIICTEKHPLNQDEKKIKTVKGKRSAAQTSNNIVSNVRECKQLKTNSMVSSSKKCNDNFKCGGIQGINKKSLSATQESLQSHESRVKESLDDALQAMLGQCASSSSSYNKSSAQGASNDLCSLCNQCLSTATIIYKAPCSHNVCRNCITQSTTELIQCPMCNETYLKTTVVRAHYSK